MNSVQLICFETGSFDAIISMARFVGLQSSEYTDDRGGIWLEIRQSAFFRVPFHGYRTHLIRLIVDQHFTYWLEVLGYCVRSGTFRAPASGGIDPNLVKPVFDLLANGNAIVCHGRGNLSIEFLSESALLERGLASRNYFTLPDYRYRSYDCLRLIDNRSGVTQCVACLRPSQPHLSPSLEGINSPCAFQKE